LFKARYITTKKQGTTDREKESSFYSKFY